MAAGTVVSAAPIPPAPVAAGGLDPQTGQPVVAAPPAGARFDPEVIGAGNLLPRLLTTPIPMALNDFQQLLKTTNTRCCSLPMTPTDFQRLLSRELTPQPYSTGCIRSWANRERRVGRGVGAEARDRPDTALLS